MDDVNRSYVPELSAELGSRVTLHLGVLDQPYRSRMRARGERRRVKGPTLPVTTGDVAEILEAKYGVMEAFWRVKADRITRALERAMSDAIETLVKTGRSVSPWGDAAGEIESLFRDFIDSREAERVGIMGTPTQAALRGVNHRLKHPYAKGNPRRPSFKDTGLYSRSFRFWAD